MLHTLSDIDPNTRYVPMDFRKTVVRLEVFKSLFMKLFLKLELSPLHTRNT
jgi:hypothetical protein